MARLPAYVGNDDNDDAWSQAWQPDGDGLGGMGGMRDAVPAAAPDIGPFITEVQRALGQPQEAEPAPAAPPQPEAQPEPETDPGIAGWEELRRQRRGQELQEDIEAPYQPDVGTTWLGRDLEASGWFERQRALHSAERERVRQDAIAQSERGLLARGGDAAVATGQWGRALVTVTPGGVVSGFGTAMQQPDVFVARAEFASQDFRFWQIAAMEAIDAGTDLRTVLSTVGPQRPRRPDGSVLPSPQADLFMNSVVTYQAMSPSQRARERERITAEFNAFNPIPIQDRPLYRRGEEVVQLGHGLHERFGFALPEGYDDTSWAVILGRGLGSMVSGMMVRAPLTRIFGTGAARIGTGFYFGAMGGGEATRRAVEFDRAERAAGRPGLTQQDIALVGILGTGPGVTDLAPLELLFSRLNLRVPRPVLAAMARTVGRIGGQTFVEAVQEGQQEFLQNFIAYHVYNPTQDLFANVPTSAVAGGGVGGTTQTDPEMLALARRREKPKPRQEPQNKKDATVLLCVFTEPQFREAA